MCKAKRGSFRNTAVESMLACVLKDVIKKAGIDPIKIDDVAVGNVLQPGAGSTTSRIATFLAGIPYNATVQGINRQCSSGL
jgi:acetyl-CoA acyltransferase 1